MIRKDISSKGKITWARLIYNSPVECVIKKHFAGDKKPLFGTYSQSKFMISQNGYWYNLKELQAYLGALLETKDREVYYSSQVVTRVETGDAGIGKLEYHVFKNDEEAEMFFDKIKVKYDLI